ncbi:MAG: hypothetical protein JWN95_3287, partial [Frankiales bacterium]|nr:hypothetical protein [Frankiales bacterium]
WRLAIIWQFTEIAVWIGTLLWLLSTANPNKALTYEGLTWLLLIRDGTLLVLMGCVVREMLYPETDPVRTPDDPDPGGGIFCEVPADDRRRPEHRGPAIAAEIDEPV